MGEPGVRSSSTRGGQEEGLEVSVDCQLQDLVVGGVASHHSQDSTHVWMLQVSVCETARQRHGKQIHDHAKEPGSKDACPEVI
jgi:hypothetical protein